jgi:hypothetical protein
MHQPLPFRWIGPIAKDRAFSSVVVFTITDAFPADTGPPD